MSTDELCALRIEKSAAILELRRPKCHNALSTGLLQQIVTHLSDLDEQASVRGVVITGSPVAFSAGADLNEALQMDSVASSLRYLSALRRVTTAIESLSKPVVAAIEGYCYTGGLELVLACDRRIGARGATFSVSSARIGSVAGLGGTQRLPRLVGSSVAKDILMTGRVFTAEEASAIGLLDELVDEAGSVEASLAWVEQCAEAAPLSVWLAKLAVNVGTGAPMATALELEALMTTLAFTTKDRREGMSSILEKRRPHFTGE